MEVSPKCINAITFQTGDNRYRGESNLCREAPVSPHPHVAESSGVLLSETQGCLGSQQGEYS